MHHRSRPLSLSALAALLLGLLGSATALAQPITISGDVSPNTVTNPTWDVGADLGVANSGIGSMNIATGGSVSDTIGIIGFLFGSEGTVTVSGGSWTNSSDLVAGYEGIGTLNLSSGSVSNIDGYIGLYTTSNGTVTVSGGTWTNSGGLVVGYQGTGTLNLNGGVVAATQVSLGTGTGTVTFDGGTLQLGANQANLFDGFGVGNITVAAGGGTLDTQGHTVTTGYGLTGAGGLTKTGSGTLTLSGANTYSGATTISAGTLALGASGALDSTTISVGSGATFDVSAVTNFTVGSGQTLGGSGSIHGALTFASGAHLAPGNSPGTITFADGLTLNSGVIIDFELGANTAASDLILVTGGDLISASSVTFNFSDVGGFAAGTTYDLINGAGADLTAFSAAHFTGTGIAGYTFAFAVTGSTLQLTATAVPEPSTYAAIFGALALGFVAYRKRSSRRSA